MAPEEQWAWKPGEPNSMNLGQICTHLRDATGMPTKGFVTGDWGRAPGAEVKEEDMLPTAERMPSLPKAEVLKSLEEDRLLLHKMLDSLPTEEFDHKNVFVPWAQCEAPLWMMCLQMVEHQANHKAILFSYLKRMGLPVNTMHLYGMGA
jgi:hypothetical protein